MLIQQIRNTLEFQLCVDTALQDASEHEGNQLS